MERQIDYEKLCSKINSKRLGGNMKEKYTGRQIAILTDSHGLLEPTLSALQDMEARGITEIYSLGDNIGVGPNPGEVLDLLSEYGVRSIAGNSEDYCTLGVEPFQTYFNILKWKSHLWTLSKINEKQLAEIYLYPHSIELLVGGKKLALCHFANDVRCDFTDRSTVTYRKNIYYNKKGYDQFLYTNSLEQQMKIENIIKTYGKESPMLKGYLSAKEEPLFSGHRVDKFDAIIQGHVHFKIYEKSNTTEFYTIRAVGMAYNKDPIDTASYVILKEKKNNMGFDMEEILVKFDREKMESSILNCDSPDSTTIQKFTNMKR